MVEGADGISQWENAIAGTMTKHRPHFGGKDGSADWLKKAELFEALDESQLNTILSHSRVESCPEGRIIFQKGRKQLSSMS